MPGFGRRHTRSHTRPAGAPHTPPTQVKRCLFANNGPSARATIDASAVKSIVVTNCTFTNNTGESEAAAGGVSLG